MKKCFAFTMVICLLIAMTACTAKDKPTPTTGSAPDSTSNNGSTEPSTLPVVSTGEYYRILKDDFKYIHQLFDLQGNLIEEIELQKEATIVAVNENIICLTYQTGTGKSTQWGFFYNVQTNKRSENFQWILDYTADKVILGLPEGIVVRSIFDNTYYAEITDFEKTVADVPDAILYAEFVDSDTTISVTYAEVDTYELITERVELPQQSSSGSAPQSQEKANNQYGFFDTFNIVCEEHQNYKLLTNADNTGYCYYVYDNAGELLDSGYHDYRGCSFAFKDGYLSYYNAGLTFTWHERYYDVENGRVSRFYYRPLDTHKNLVAYYGSNSNDKTVLIVSDMFDKQTYYCEFAREFSLSVLTGGSTGSFSEDGKTLTVTYIVTDHENKTDTKITETFQLP